MSGFRLRRLAMTRRSVLTAILATLVSPSGCVGEAKRLVTPTTIATYRAIGMVAGRHFDSVGFVACVPSVTHSNLGSDLGHTAFPQWAPVSSNEGEIVVLNMTALCYSTEYSDQEVLSDAFIFEDAPRPRWIQRVKRSDQIFHVERTGVRIADKKAVRDLVRRLLRYEDVFCVECVPRTGNDPYIRVLKMEISETALPPRYFETYSDRSAGDCARSKVVPAPPVAAGVESITQCVRLSQGDPFNIDNPNFGPLDRCSQFSANISALRPAGRPTEDQRLWRLDLFSDPLKVDGCLVPKADVQIPGDVRLYRSSHGVFALYGGVERSVFPARLYEDAYGDLERTQLDVSERHQ